MTPTELYDLTVTERHRLATLLAELSSAQWAAPSLCRGWRVREVVAHLTSTETQSWQEFQAAVEAASGDINLACDRTARADSARFSDGDLLGIYRRRVPSRWTPGPDEEQAALAHEVIHGLDITRPLGLADPEPSVVAAAMMGGSPESIAFFGVDLSGVRLVADDAHLVLGSDADDANEVPLPAAELALVVTGRAPLPLRSAESG